MRNLLSFLLASAFGCSGAMPATDVPGDVGPEAPGDAGAEVRGDAGPPSNPGLFAADVTHVEASGAEGAYTFSVRVMSPDTGCERYADWWEVVDPAGRLRYRRILLHSHVGEQPFTRSGGPVDISATDPVWIRAHLNTGGYGAAMTGTPQSGFTTGTPPEGFAAELESTPPLPADCAF